MTKYAFATIRELRAALDGKEISAQELLSYCVARFKKHDSQIKSALEIFDENSMKAVPGSGPLAGIPGLVKDNICQEGRITSCASRVLENYRAVYDATVVERLKKAGAVSVGRANMDEFGMGGSTEYSAYQKTHNPWDLTRVPGGSGGGSAAAVAAGLVPWALGTETGGSVRQPAAFCGIVGSKPTYGLVSRYGVVAYGSSLDQVGINTRTVYDNALVFSVLAGHDEKDSSSLNVSAKDYTKALDGSIRSGLKIGVVENALHAEGMDPEVSSLLVTAIEELKKMGASVTMIKIPVLDYAAATYFILSRAEAASNLARFDGVRYGVRAQKSATLHDVYFNTRREGFGKTVRRRIMIGNYVLSAGYADQFYHNANKVRVLMRAELASAFQGVDLLFMPTQAAPAFKLGALDKNALQMDLQDYFTAFANITGVPAISVPCGFTKEKLPVGFQLVGPHLSEELLFQTAHAYETRTPWHTMHPEQWR